jgi:D-aminopeptidase
VARARELGIRIGTLQPGPLDAITDVAGVRVGSVTLIEGDGLLRRGHGPVRTGVTVVVPDGERLFAPCFAGCHRLNGNGELTGLEWVRESGRLTTPVGLTNTHSVGVVRDALVAAEVARRGDAEPFWSLPVVGETWDGELNDINGFHVRPEHLHDALARAAGGPVEEGGVGGGTGMICHGFKGGIGTASRTVPEVNGGFTVGVLVQANHGRRARLAVDGYPVGRVLGADVVPEPSPRRPGPSAPPPGAGSIIVVCATDAPLLPHQCTRLAQRCALGIARTGGAGEHSSGDLLLAFSTAHRDLPSTEVSADDPVSVPVEMLADSHIDPLFHAAVEATEAAIVNALLAAETMTGRDGITAHAIGADRLLDALRRLGASSGPR